MASWPRSARDILQPPPEPRENLVWRARLTELWVNDPRPEIVSPLLSLSAKNILWTFDALYFTKDPRKTPSERPFALYPYERDLIRQFDTHLAAGTDLLIEKTRDMGVTWCVLGWLLWHWRFDASFNAIVGSRLEDLIDEKGNLDTHFERLRWLLRNLPAWWMPNQFDEARHLGMAFSEAKHVPYMRLMRPDSDNTIVGEAVSEDFSRQGRYNVAWIDEAAACEHLDGAWTATADSAPMRLLVSTPKGLGNKFATLRRAGTIDVVSLHWSRHPEKSKGLTCQTHGAQVSDCAWPRCQFSSPWYVGQCTRRLPHEIAQELDIDYLGAGNPYFDLVALERQQAVPPLALGFLVEVDQGVEFRSDVQGIWHLFELPPPLIPGTLLPTIRCVIGGDPAEGIGGDFSFAVVRDGVDRGVKATLRGQLPPEDFAHELSKAGRFYRQAVIGCELNQQGYAVNQDLVRSYGNVYHQIMTEREDRPVSKKFGWVTGVKTKEPMLAQLAEEIRGGAAALRDGVLIEECKTFVRDEDGKLHADSGFHDDGVMACAIAGMLINQLQTMRPMKRPRPLLMPQTTNLAG